MLCTSHAARAQLALVPQAKHVQAEHGPPAPVALPQEFAPPQEAYAAFPEEPAAAAAPAAPSACQLRLAKIAVFQALPTLVGPGECGAVDAVHLDAVILPDQSKVAVTPAGILRCPMAEELAHWVREDVAPTATKLGSPLRVLDNFDSYECRGRNRVRGATLSEHGRADAIDVRLFKLADGRSLTLTDVNVDKAWRETIKASVCARFSTVLGPGSDGNHEEHIHLDLAERRNNYKLCEWDVREPP
ncbi:MAG TPA: extensin family protein, partial [Xanthobacteraceae bacterium]|nr:extensin family protein [Xanthobacteraceae bacterium]